jgi:hypothetical protein
MEEVKVRIEKSIAEQREERIKAWLDRTVALVAVLSAIAAVASAIALHYDATESLGAQIETMRRDQRSFVFVKPVDWAPVKSHSFVSKIMLAAYGKTPATRVFLKMLCRKSVVTETEAELRKTLAASPIIIPASSAMYPDDRLTETCYPDIDDLNSNLQMLGVVTYLDVFHEEHTTEFCYVSSIPLDAMVEYKDRALAPCVTFTPTID